MTGEIDTTVAIGMTGAEVMTKEDNPWNFRITSNIDDYFR
jgi:hypothetical protein